MLDNPNKTSWWQFQSRDNPVFGFSWACFVVTLCLILLQSPQLLSASIWSSQAAAGAFGIVIGGLAVLFAIPTAFAYIAWRFGGRSRHAATAAYCLVAVGLFTASRFGEMRMAKAGVAPGIASEHAHVAR